MNVHNSLLDNFSSMQAEFNSSNNRALRAIEIIFDEEFGDLENSLDYFNGEYLVVDKRKLVAMMAEFRRSLAGCNEAHDERCKINFNRESEHLKQTLCNFFEKKLVKGNGTKKTICSEVKDTFDRMGDYNFIGLEELLDTVIYNFKVKFETDYINDEYCKDDFNKILRSFEHSLFDRLRSKFSLSVAEKQEIFSRYVLKAYEILDLYKNDKRRI